MKISEYLEYLSKEWDGVDDRKVLIPLVAALSPVSKQTIISVQPKQLYESNGDFGAFANAQAKEIKQCIELELHEMGAAVRKHFNLPPLTLDTEILPL